MKKLTGILSMSFLFFSFVILNLNTIDYEIKDDFVLKIKGDSNVHKWESTIEEMTGSASVEFDADGIMQISECTVRIPVNSIKSSKGKKMDKKTMKALNEKEYPVIDFSLISFENVQRTDSTFTAEASGNLTVAGSTKDVGLNINGTQHKNGTIEIQCSKDMKMTDFNIKPPTALLGVMRTKDDITIEFQITLDSPSIQD